MPRLAFLLPCALVCCSAGWSATGSAKSSDWPQWRGPTRQGCSPEQGIPDAFPAEGPRLLWNAPLKSHKASSTHCANGSALVFSELVYAQSADGKTDTVVCFRLADGKKAWEYSLAEGGAGNGTPVIDPATGRLYAAAYGKTDFKIACLDAQSGKEIWKADKGKTGVVDYKGAAANQEEGCASPLVLEDKLIVATDTRLLALDKAAGRVLWSWPEKTFAPREFANVAKRKSEAFQAEYEKMDKALLVGIKATSSPVVAGPPDRPVIIQSVTRQADTGYTSSTVALDAKSGQQLWLGPLMGSHHTPVFADGVLVTSVFEGDIVKAYALPMKVIGLKPEWMGDRFEMKEVWRHAKSTCQRYRMPAPAAFDKRVYWRDGRNDLFCFEAATGKLLWQNNQTEGSWALTSPLFVDGKVFVLGEGGVLTVIKDDGAAGNMLLKKKICNETGASPAFAGGKLIVRDYATGLFCYDLKASE